MVEQTRAEDVGAPSSASGRGVGFPHRTVVNEVNAAGDCNRRATFNSSHRAR